MVAARPRSTPRCPTVLLTGFEPFGGDGTNPSWEAVQALHGRQILGHRIVSAQLPTVFGESLATLRPLLRQHRPDLVIGCGLASGRAGLSLERVALNLDDARIADNRGAQPIDTPIVPGGPAAYFSTLPIKSMLAALQEAGIPAEVSQSAGTFVCNHLFYGLMHTLASTRALRHTRGGFIHVPWLPGHGEPALPLETLVAGLRMAVRVALATRQDACLTAGALS
jgi:pyroglutamyl-peptidase